MPAPKVWVQFYYKIITPIAYASKAFTSCQQRYAQIEKEMLAEVFGCTCFHEYIYRMPIVEIEIDHKPLKANLKKLFHQAPARLQRMIMAILNLIFN